MNLTSDSMYGNIFSDLVIDDRRMKKRIRQSMPFEEDEREAQPIERPLPERERPLPSRYDDERRDANRDRYFEQLQRADLYRFGY